MRALKAGSLYFLIAFAAGWVLGPIREFWVTPRLGITGAILVEGPLMLLVSFVAARFILRRFALHDGRERLLMGLAALLLLLAAEFLATIALRGLTPSAYVAHFATAPGLLSLVLFLVFAAMPLFVSARAAPSESRA